jgi:hypothetical protein
MFGYLAGSSRPEMARVRSLFEDWLSRYPVDEAKDLIGTFSATDDRDHLAAAFELLLHELLIRRECSVKIHPVLAHSTRRPDFLVTPANGEPFFLEARSTSDMSDAAYRAHRFEGEYIEALQGIHSPDFGLWVTMHRHPNEQPPYRQAAAELEAKIAKLDYEEYAEKWFNYQGERHPRFEREYDGWRVDIAPIPRPRQLRGTPNPRPVIVHGMGIAEGVTCKKSVKKALYKKSKRYGQLDVPYVIAINYTGWASIQAHEMIEVLYDNIKHARVDEPDGGLTAMPHRAFDGFWTKARKPRNQNVSGVLLFNRAAPVRLASTTAMYYRNPWANLALGDGVLGVSACSTDENGELQVVDGLTPRELFELPEGWPDMV